MNILELSAYFYPHKGGIESIIYYLASEWTKNRESVTIITSDQGSKREFDVVNKIKIHYLKSFIFMQDAIFLSVFRKIRQLNELNKFDIAHIHHPHPFILFFGSLICKKNKIPYVIHMHGRELVFDGWKNIVAKLYNLFMLNYSLKNSEAIMVHTRKVINKSKYLIKYKNKIKYNPHGINLKEFDFNKLESKSKLKKKLNLINKKIILFVGVLRDYKRLDILIKAMPKIIKKVPNSLLIIAGKGPEEKRLKRLTTKLKLNDFVRFLGFLPDNLKCKYYKAADLFILPSPTIMESFGTVAFEAFAMKCPVIVTRGAGIAEVFEKEKIGLISEPFSSQDIADKAIKLLNNKKYCTKITNRAYEIIKKKYQWGYIADKYLDTFNTIIKNK